MISPAASAQPQRNPSPARALAAFFFPKATTNAE